VRQYSRCRSTIPPSSRTWRRSSSGVAGSSMHSTWNAHISIAKHHFLSPPQGTSLHRLCSRRSSAQALVSGTEAVVTAYHHITKSDRRVGRCRYQGILWFVCHSFSSDRRTLAPEHGQSRGWPPALGPTRMTKESIRVVAQLLVLRKAVRHCEYSKYHGITWGGLWVW